MCNTDTQVDDANGDCVLENKWSLYFHFKDRVQHYTNSYMHIFDTTTVRHWAELAKFVPGIEVIVSPFTELRVSEKTIVAYSFFKDDIRPEWESTANYNGHTISARVAASPERLHSIWITLTCDLARGAVDASVLGVQFVKKDTYRRSFFLKLDVWLASTADVPTKIEYFNKWGRPWHLVFNHVHRLNSAA